MIPQEQIEKFIKNMAVKGYKDNYAAPGIPVCSLSEALNTYLDNRLSDGKLSRAFPFWIGTIVEGKIGDPQFTLAHFKVDYSADSGFQIDEYKLLTWERKKDNVELKIHHKIKSIAELPTISMAQKKIKNIQQLMKISKKRRLGL